MSRIPSLSAFSLRFGVGIAVAMILLASLSAHAEGFTGLELYKVCNNGYGRPDDKTICIAYIRGFSDGLWEGIGIGQMVAEKGRRACIPNLLTSEPVNPEQAELIIKKFLADNPGRLGEPAVLLAFDAFVKAFPCRSAP